jgi:RNA polymerase sigma-54 factor
MLRQNLQQKQLQKLSPQQIQLMKLLQVPTVMLEQRIKQEIEENPALEEGGETDDIEELNLDNSEDFEATIDENENPDGDELSEPEIDADNEFDLSDYIDEDDTPLYRLNANNTSPDEERKDIPYSAGISFNDMLTSQLGLKHLSEKEYNIAATIIGNIDDSGYLQRSLDALVDDLAFSQNIETTLEELSYLLSIIQEFDPPGIGAKDLQECLLIQLRRKPEKTANIDKAILILEKSFESFTKKHYDKICQKHNLTELELKGAIDEILKLNPKPGNSVIDSQKLTQYIVPDFTITTYDNQLELSLNSRNAPELRINRTYAEMLETMAETKGKTDKRQKEALMFVKQKLDGARWFIDAIKQRQNTLLVTMEAIMDYQKDFFLSGDETNLKPMILKDIAEIVNLDISTISRVANSKYVQTPYGTYLLKYFFSESLQNDAGEEVSTREVKKILEDCIGEEDKKKPLTDEELAAILKEKGYNIARRTVAKYREQLDIPVARLRKELN